MQSAPPRVAPAGAPNVQMPQGMVTAPSQGVPIGAPPHNMVSLQPGLAPANGSQPTSQQNQYQPVQYQQSVQQHQGMQHQQGAHQQQGMQQQQQPQQQGLRHQQQRLLLLRHAAKCQHDDGHCPVTPHCAGMKRLWKHIAECKDQKCLVPHCVSSRYVLSHYHRCKDVRCPVCGPVREAIHRSHEKQKQMQAFKQRHQQAVQKPMQSFL